MFGMEVRVREEHIYGILGTRKLFQRKFGIPLENQERLRLLLFLYKNRAAAATTAQKEDT